MSIVTEPSFIPLAQAARRLGVPQAFLEREAKAGNVPSVATGRRLMFDVDAAKQALDNLAGGCDDDQTYTDKYLAASDIANRLNVGTGNIQKWAKDGVIPCTTIGQTLRFDWVAVEAALAKMAGFKAERPHLQVQIVTQRKACEALNLPMAGLRSLAESGDIPSFQIGEGPQSKLFFVLDDVCTALFKLSNEIPYQQYLRSLRPPSAKRKAKGAQQ